MRSEDQIKAKIVELLGLDGEDRQKQLEALGSLSKDALTSKTVEHHSTRGMLEALYWALGYEFEDIIQQFVDPSVQHHRG